MMLAVSSVSGRSCGHGRCLFVGAIAENCSCRVSVPVDDRGQMKNQCLFAPELKTIDEAFQGLVGYIGPCVAHCSISESASLES
jgi:hypothetical protein